ncbi:hypothetical protein BJ322DRAFT_851719 [Thelephora terrestris]|uniref:NACHT domain-containing protein n=1 Tax=Thelephora terrestris TaxID=56493 RepID=A0A9P6HCZ6_9AGAM|nr:hypothetical protein BJ322DRAFT_851719 [Thelephora terrestris]
MFKKRRSTSFEATGSNQNPGSGRTKQRISDCAKTLLDTAKESADVCIPLKPILGGVSALVKHYEQFEDVKEKVEELIPLLNRFKQDIATATVEGDPEETNRRLGLIRKFKEIEDLSEKLSAKGSITRFVDRGEDSKLVARLIERFRETILYYQISQQQGIYRQINHLTSSFGTLLKLQEKPLAVRIKLESVVAQLNRLRDAPWKELQHERWAKLFDDLRPIKDKATCFYEHLMAEGYVEGEGDIVAVSELAEGLRDVLLGYQTVQQQEIYNQNCRLIDAADLLVLNNCLRARGAEYRHGDRRGCLKGTRDTVLAEIESWAKDFTKSPVFWLNGLAGTGKSTIAQTISERVFAEARLGASFFCSRDFEDRSNLRSIFPTIAFQLAHKYPDFRSHLVPLLRSNPDVAHEPLYSQMQKLVAEPLRETGISTVIVIDALDECKDDEPSSAILSVLGRFVGDIPKVKFFITGRPEPRIRTGFRLPLLVDSTNVFVLHDVHPSLINNDIRLYLKHELSELAQRRRLERWPSDEHIDLLCHRAAGFFVYAVATVKFLSSTIHLPKKQLGVILKLPESTAPEGKTRYNPNTTLDSLYTSILEAAISDADPEVDSRVRTTIGTIILAVNPLPPLAIAELMSLDPEEVILFLTCIQSLLSMGEDPNQPIKPFHKSFPDFIVDPSRCANPRFRISPEHLHHELVTNCLRIMNDGLEQNLLSLPAYSLNSEVKDLQTRINNRIGIALQYACQSWHSHLVETREGITGVISYLTIFLKNNFLAWLEVLSVLGEVGGAAVGLEKLMTWLQKDDSLLDIAQDCFNFVTKFFEPIKVSATHVYHSALELCPMSSIVRGLYSHRCQPLDPSPRVVIGAPRSWNQAISISNKDREHGFCIWSPCGRFVATQTAEAVEIRDQLTFQLLNTLQPAEATHPLTGPLAYLPDGCSLACVAGTSVVIWDIQTGGVAKEFECGFKSTSMVWSLDGGKIGFFDSQKNVYTYDLASSTILSHEKSWSEGNQYLWAQEKSFGILTVVPGSSNSPTRIEFFEVGRTLVRTQSLSTWNCSMTESQYIPEVSYSPVTRRFSVSSDRTLHVFDLESRFLDEVGLYTFHCFSSDGTLFAAATTYDIRVWRLRKDRGTRSSVIWKRFYCPGPTLFLQFSPTQFSILGHVKGIFHGWRLHDRPTPTTDRLFHAGLPHSRNYVAVAYKSESTVTIINLRSRAPSRLIETGVEIEALVVTGNVLLVLGWQKVVGWLLTEEGLVGGVSDGRNAGPGDSIWAVSLSHSEYAPIFKVEGQVGMIAPDRDSPRYFIYHTETGKVLPPDQVPQHSSSPGKTLGHVPWNQDSLGFHNLSQQKSSPESSWQTLEVTWVRDPEGKHRLWLPVEWRSSWVPMEWRQGIATQLGFVGIELVILKFWR